LDPILQALLNTFVGGEVEVQNPIERYLYRGRIKTIVSDTSAGYGTLKIGLLWQVKGVVEVHRMAMLPVGGWDETPESDGLEYSCNTDLPSPEIDAPNIPNAQFIGGGRMMFRNPYNGEVAVLFPAGGSQLDPEKVRWLPDGPRARADAEANKAQETSTTEPRE
jgi:hypothetical protein